MLPDHHYLFAQSVLEAYLSHQFQCPGASLFAEFVRAAMQQLKELLESFFGERGAQSMEARRSLAKHAETVGIEAIDEITHHLIVTAQVACDLWRSFSIR